MSNGLNLTDEELADVLKNPDVKIANIDTAGTLAKGLCEAAAGRNRGGSAESSPPARNKYLNTPTFFNGREYQSKAEAVYAQDNSIRIKAGELLASFEQVPFVLAGGIVYRADFVEILPDWSVVVVDVKPHDWKTGKLRLTQDYRNKKKLFREKFGKEIIEK